jgi:tRNA (guanine37-N1)-methyltransferase
MKFTILSIFPELVTQYFSKGVLQQAIKNQLVEMQTINPRDFTSDAHRTVDDRPFGGGDGMVMKVEPLAKASESIIQSSDKKPFFVYLSPQGNLLNDALAQSLAQKEHLVFICGRYGGIDQRYLNQYVDMELSIGDYVLSGGEAAAIVAIEAISRKIPGVLGHKDSAQKDSFAQNFLEEPQFTRPQLSLQQQVPDILLSGHHENIESYKNLVAKLVTLKKRPDLIDESEIPFLHESYNSLSEEERKTLGIENLFQ